MRSLLAAILDAVVAAVLGYAGFRIALWAAPCGKDLADCFPLTPLIVLCVGVGVGLYFGCAYLIWRTTAARKFLRVEGISPGDDDV